VNRGLLELCITLEILDYNFAPSCLKGILCEKRHERQERIDSEDLYHHNLVYARYSEDINPPDVRDRHVIQPIKKAVNKVEKMLLEQKADFDKSGDQTKD
jgi:hypothetical protein